MALIDVVEFKGNPDEFAWKFPDDELGTWTQLVVHQTQEAVLFKDGRALDLFGPGRHTLTTANIPLLGSIVNLPFGGKSPFKAEVWFVNKTHVLDMKWGTASPVKLQDPKYNIIVPVRAYGQLGLRIDDSRKFLLKLVGTLGNFGREELSQYFRGLFLMNFKAILSSFFIHRKISILEVNAYLTEISQHVQDNIAATLDEYGIKIVNLYVNSVNLPDQDPSIVRLRNALARKAEMDIVGYNYQQERTFDTLEGAAKNEGGNAAVMGAGLGLGVGVGIGGAVGGQFADMTHALNTGGTFRSKLCPKCRHVNTEDAHFCSKCGSALSDSSSPVSADSPVQCNACGATLPKGSKFCPRCGDRYHACPKCATDNPESAETCVKCGEPMPWPCPNCKKNVDAGNRFCPHCGIELVLSCPKCRHDVQHGQKFCVECGYDLKQEGAET
jgi:membrane protease subunit (stomatin/prohibitin family)